MRRSTARLARSKVLLADLSFPHQNLHIHRTRLPFIHFDNVLHYAKVDRDGKVDGFLGVYLPDELTVLFLRSGVLVNAVAFRESGRQVLPIAPALQHIKKETERGELVYGAADPQQLAWMFQSCSQPAAPRFVDQTQPAALLQALQHEVFSGVVELISNGRVNYLQFENGDFQAGFFSHKRDDQSVEEYVHGLFRPGEDQTPAEVAAAVFTDLTELPEQASPEMVQAYRELFWGLANAAEQEANGSGLAQAIKYRDLLSTMHSSLPAIGRPLDDEAVDVLTTPEELTSALAEWAMQFLDQVEIVAPGAAPDVLKRATKEHRFKLQRTGFYDRLPWTVNW